MIISTQLENSMTDPAIFTAKPALGTVRMRLLALATDILQNDTFGGTRSIEAACDIRTFVDAIWDVMERACDDGHQINSLRDQVDELDFERTALRAERDELLAAAKMARAIIKSGGVVPIDGVTLLSLEEAISNASPAGSVLGPTGLQTRDVTP